MLSEFTTHLVANKLRVRLLTQFRAQVIQQCGDEAAGHGKKQACGLVGVVKIGTAQGPAQGSLRVRCAGDMCAPPRHR